MSLTLSLYKETSNSQLLTFRFMSAISAGKDLAGSITLEDWPERLQKGKMSYWGFIQNWLRKLHFRSSKKISMLLLVVFLKDDVYCTPENFLCWLD